MKGEINAATLRLCEPLGSGVWIWAWASSNQLIWESNKLIKVNVGIQPINSFTRSTHNIMTYSVAMVEWAE